MNPNHNRNRIKTITIAERALRLCSLLAVSLLLYGCKPEGKVAKDTAPTGTYALVSVDGKQVPATIDHDGTAIKVNSGTFTINADGTCSTKTVFVPPSGAEASKEVSATYTREGSKLTMQWSGAGTTTGTVEGNTFTMNNEGMLFVYRK
jgi:hypothetical protein